jgi:hypothetical protein
MTFSELQALLRGIYGDRNRRDGFSRELYTFSKMLMTALRLQKAVFDQKSEQIEGTLAMLVAWLLGYRKMDTEPIGELVWRHFPDWCPYCVVAPCKCAQIEKGERNKPLLFLPLLNWGGFLIY